VRPPHCCFSAREPRKPSSHYLPTPRNCGGCDGFNPQPDKPDYPDLRPPLTRDPGSTVGIIIEGGAPSPSLNPGDTTAFIIYG